MLTAYFFDVIMNLKMNRGVKQKVNREWWEGFKLAVLLGVPLGVLIWGMM